MTEQVKVSYKLDKKTATAVFGDGIEFDKPLAPLTSYRTGGPAKYFLEAASAEQLSGAVRSATELNLPFFVMGGGSNLLVSDSGFDGLVIRVGIKGMDLEGDASIRCGAGEDLMALVDFATTSSLTGLEFAAGIWGTVGGAIYGNAGAYGGEMKDVLTELTLSSRDGDIKTVDPEYCRFSYRDSHLKVTHEIVVNALFKLAAGDKLTIESTIADILASREEKHPTQGKSAGCFFKNIPDPKEEHGKLPAGRLLEEAGVKGLAVGGAEVYAKHANMIVNTGNATSKDIRKLADIMKDKVLGKFGITLQEEVIQLGEF